MLKAQGSSCDVSIGWNWKQRTSGINRGRYSGLKAQVREEIRQGREAVPCRGSVSTDRRGRWLLMVLMVLMVLLRAAWPSWLNG